MQGYSFSADKKTVKKKNLEITLNVVLIYVHSAVGKKLDLNFLSACLYFIVLFVNGMAELLLFVICLPLFGKGAEHLEPLGSDWKLII